MELQSTMFTLLSVSSLGLLNSFLLLGVLLFLRPFLSADLEKSQSLDPLSPASTLIALALSANLLTLPALHTLMDPRH